MTNGIKQSILQDITMAIRDHSQDYSYEMEVHSPTDSSEDSVEVKISPISLRNKRKCAEPRKCPETQNYPLKKRMCLKVKAEINAAATASSASTSPTPISIDAHPFRPWSPKPSPSLSTSPSSSALIITGAPSSIVKNEPYFRPPSPPVMTDMEPVALIKKPTINHHHHQQQRVPIHPQVTLTTAETERIIRNTNEIFPNLQQSNNTKREQRNYKNMTRERRIEANARERTRVHTISAAFDTLRKSIPSYSHNQKLSKLSVLRIACSYIMTLSSIVSNDNSDSSSSSSNSSLSTADCVELVTKTIQREGKLRKKKDDND